jgi:hypothetical protein
MKQLLMHKINLIKQEMQEMQQTQDLQQPQQLKWLPLNLKTACTAL